MCVLCHKKLVLNEIITRGEIEGAGRLRELMAELLKEKDQLHQGSRQLDTAINGRRKALEAAEIMHRLEIETLRSQLLQERDKNRRDYDMLVTLADAAHNQDDQLKAEEYEAQLQANKLELDRCIEQNEELVAELSDAQSRFQGLISFKSVLETVCRSCRTKAKQSFRQEMMQGGFSEVFSTITRMTRSEFNRETLIYGKKETCKCVLM
jgi:hypothetical protein